jgi:hypothetical protein
VFSSVATPSTAKLMTTTRKKSGPGIVSAASALRFRRAFVTSLRSLTDCDRPDYGLGTLDRLVQGYELSIRLGARLAGPFDRVKVVGQHRPVVGDDGLAHRFANVRWKAADVVEQR